MRDSQVKNLTENQKETQLNKQTPNVTKDKRSLGTKMKVPNIQVKKVKDPSNSGTEDSLEGSVKSVQNKLKSCSVCLMKPLPGNPPVTPSSPNQTLFPSETYSQSTSPTTKPNQGLNLLEYPLIRYMTESTPFSNAEVELYVIQAIKHGEITFITVNDDVDESPVLSKAALKGCRENSLLSNRKKAQFKKVEDKVLQVSRDPKVREDSKKKGRLVSESELTERECLAKTVQTVSP